jgi:hypothetical protein
MKTGLDGLARQSCANPETAPGIQVCGGGQQDWAAKYFVMALFAVPSRLNPTAKRWACRTAFCAAALMGCLEAGAASALSFNFSFSGDGFPNTPATVTGTVDGLVDNLNDQVTGITVTVTSATNGPAPITFTDADYVYSGDGFDVAGGQIGDVDIMYTNPSFFTLILANHANPNSLTPYYADAGSFGNDNLTASSSVLVFTPVAPASVPGPLPLLGAGAAFGWSRRLRRRIKVSA